MLPELGELLANITLDVLPLGDHELFAMYEAAYGIGEFVEPTPTAGGRGARFAPGVAETVPPICRQHARSDRESP